MSVFGSWAVLHLRVSYTATSNGGVGYGEAEGTRQKDAIACLTVSTLALDHLTKTAFPVEFQNWVSSKLPFRTFRPVSAYSVLGFQVFMWQYYCRVSNWVSSRLPFRTFRPVSAYPFFGIPGFHLAILLCYVMLLCM